MSLARTQMSPKGVNEVTTGAKECTLWWINSDHIKAGNFSDVVSTCYWTAQVQGSAPMHLSAAVYVVRQPDRGYASAAQLLLPILQQRVLQFPVSILREEVVCGCAQQCVLVRNMPIVPHKAISRGSQRVLKPAIIGIEYIVSSLPSSSGISDTQEDSYD